MNSPEDRLWRVEARLAIEELAVRYGFAVDDRDLATIRELFAPGAVLRTQQGSVKGTGVDGVVGYFRDHLPNLGPTNHFVHGHVIDFDDDDRHAATGMVSAHAEVWRAGTPMITAMRYLDAYRFVEGRWLFQERVQAYMYFTDVRDYPEVLGSRLRMRTSAEPGPADWPTEVT